MVVQILLALCLIISCIYAEKVPITWGTASRVNDAQVSLSRRNHKCFMYGLDNKFVKMILQANTSAAEGVLPRGVARTKSVNVPPGGAGKHADSSMWIRVNDNDATVKKVPKDVYPASQGQDLMVLELLGHKKGGFYIDIGARYWHKGSNTFALDYYHGWNGICVEPDSHFFRGLAINRTCTVICNNPIDMRAGNSLPFSYAIGQTVARKGHDHGEKVTVNMKTVMDKLGKRVRMPTVIDYLSLDVEGAELATLRGMDLDRYVFLVMSIERPTMPIHLLLLRSGYSWLTQLGDLGSNLGNRQSLTTANSSSMRYFGECIYIHKSIPRYKEFMNAYRPTAVAAWRYAVDVKADYLERPPWKVHNLGRV